VDIGEEASARGARGRPTTFPGPMMHAADRPNVLVLYGLLQHPVRAWHRDHIYSFRRYGRGRYFYVNLGVRRVPRWLRSVRFDAVIFHHTLTGQRMQPPILAWQLNRARALKGIAPTRIALLQDECIYTDLMSELIEEFAVDHVFSLAPETEWTKIYPNVDHDRVRFHRMLAGYLDEDTLGRVERIVADAPGRPVDIGYRAWSGLLSLGRHGVLRRRLAEAFEPAAAKRGLVTDISVEMGDVHHGDDWYRFLASCKYVLGAEGGATVLDPKGEFMVRTKRYLDQHPGASFEEVEAACFPGEDGKLQLFAISPRHLEACATRTCQVLVEGQYSGVLRPGEHYIEVKRDLSNIEEVLDLLQRDDLRERLTENAYRDVVASGRYTYRSLVESVESESGLAMSTAREPEAPRLLRRHRMAERADRVSWLKMASYVRSARALRWIGTRILPRRVTDRIRDRLAGGSAVERAETQAESS
jgi:hypothetical protein